MGYTEDLGYRGRTPDHGGREKGLHVRVQDIERVFLNILPLEQLHRLVRLLQPLLFPVRGSVDLP